MAACVCAVDDLQPGVSDVQYRADSAAVSTPVDVHPAAHDRHVQVRCQQVPAENQLSHIHGQYTRQPYVELYRKFRT